MMRTNKTKWLSLIEGRNSFVIEDVHGHHLTYSNPFIHFEENDFQNHKSLNKFTWTKLIPIGSFETVEELRTKFDEFRI